MQQLISIFFAVVTFVVVFKSLRSLWSSLKASGLDDIELEKKIFRSPLLWIILVLGVLYPFLWMCFLAWQERDLARLPETPLSSLMASAVAGDICALDEYPSIELITDLGHQVVGTRCDGAGQVRARIHPERQDIRQSSLFQALSMELQRRFDAELAARQQRDRDLGFAPRQMTMPALTMHLPPSWYWYRLINGVMLILVVVGCITTMVVLTLLMRVAAYGLNKVVGEPQPQLQPQPRRSARWRAREQALLQELHGSPARARLEEVLREEQERQAAQGEVT